jgi:hypothetical protein
MGLTNVDFNSAMRRLADVRIEEAMREGKFDNLPGAGKPLDLEDMPADENARMTWWCIRLLRQNDVVPDEIQMRKQIERLSESMNHVRDEDALELLVLQINRLVRQVNTLGTNAMKSPVAPININEARQSLRRRLR